MALINNSDTSLALLQGSSSNGLSNGGSAAPNHIQGGNSMSSGSRTNASGKASSSGAGVPSSSLQKQPRPSSTARANVAAFLTKLYNMVSDEGSNDLIKWSDDGHSFLVLRHVEFAKEVLPKFFKHNNFSSFVRQLNMYGFHKVPHLQQGVLIPDAESEQWEFSNQHFQKNQPDLLCLVSRKKASNGSDDKDPLTMDLGHILQEVTAIKKHQVAISSDLKNIERDHQSLWQESIAARERHQRQQETIDKILRFLASVFSGEKKRAIVPNKKPRLTITEGSSHDDHGSEVDQESEEEHEEEVTKLLGSKRKRASMVKSEADYILPGMESRGLPKTKPTLSMSEMTPATLALLANANMSAQASPASMLSRPTAANTTPASIPATSALPSNPTPIPSASVGIQDYLPSLLTTNYAAQPFKLDASNLTIPSTLLPNGISPVHHDMLRSISMANAQGPVPPPLPQSFAQTPAGANVVKGVDDITKEMEQLQRSIEALEAHGLNVSDFNFDDSYLNASAFDPSEYGDMGGIHEDGLHYHDPLDTHGDSISEMINTDQDDFAALHAMPVSPPVSVAPSSTAPASPANITSSVSSPLTSSPSPSVNSRTVLKPVMASSINPRTSTVGDEHLEEALHGES
ncbi:stress-responsive transcription factor hsf1 [Dissophora globulifera]|nr:stress-responsive transcription factor hsf1 [Dissophora globulifera]